MTQAEPNIENLFDCPICLSPLLFPITLPCGHKYRCSLSSFCEPCIKNKGFKVLQPLCPICRREIRVKLKVPYFLPQYFEVNLILERLVREKYGQSEVSPFVRGSFTKRECPATSASSKRRRISAFRCWSISEYGESSSSSTEAQGSRYCWHRYSVQIN
jgi:hypothetical protein